MDTSRLGPALEILYEEKAQLETTIQTLERMQGKATSKNLSTQDTDRTPLASHAADILRRQGKPMTASEIIDALVARGIPKKGYQVVYTTLTRRAKQNLDIVKRDGKWALLDWYKNEKENVA